MFSRIVTAHSVRRVLATGVSRSSQQQHNVPAIFMATTSNNNFSTAAELVPGVGFGKTSTGIVSNIDVSTTIIFGQYFSNKNKIVFTFFLFDCSYH